MSESDTIQTQRTGSAGPHQFADAMLAAVLVAVKEHTLAIRELSAVLSRRDGAECMNVTSGSLARR